MSPLIFIHVLSGLRVDLPGSTGDRQEGESVREGQDLAVVEYG